MGVPDLTGVFWRVGAHGETLLVPNAGRHLVNNLNWVTLMQEEGRRLKGGFRGLVITGIEAKQVQSS